MNRKSNAFQHMIYRAACQFHSLVAPPGCIEPDTKISRLWKHRRVELNNYTDRWSLLVISITQDKPTLTKLGGRNYWHCMMGHPLDGVHAVDTLNYAPVSSGLL